MSAADNLPDWITARRLSAVDRHRLTDLLVGGGLALRRMRFGGGMSDFAVRRHCEGVDFEEVAIFGAFRSGRLTGVVEIWPLEEEAAEIVFAYPRAEPDALCRRLAYAALAEVRARGVRLLRLEGFDRTCPLMRALAAAGAMRQRGGGAVEIATPACVRSERQPLRKRWVAAIEAAHVGDAERRLLP